MPKICAIMIKPLRRSGFRLDGLITSNPKVRGSHPLRHTKRKHSVQECFFFCIPKTTRWASGPKEAVADEEKENTLSYSRNAVRQLQTTKQRETFQG